MPLMPFMPSSSSVVFSFAVASFAFAACGDRGGATPSGSVSASGAPVLSSSTAAGANASPSASASAKNAPKKARPTGIGKEKARIAKDKLAEGRKLAHEKKWKDAITAFEASAAADPADARPVAEIGFAAYEAGDLDRADQANDKALPLTANSIMRAQILFNEGLVAEKRGDKSKAAARYRASLALRANDAVKKHLATVEGTPANACDAAFADADALCACLKTNEPLEAGMVQEAPTCAVDATKASSGLAVLTYGGDLGERPHFLVDTSNHQLKRLGSLGEDFEPGAFGVHNSTDLDTIETKTVGGHALALVHWTESDTDTNIGGIEINSLVTKNTTICVLGAAGKGTVCPATVPVEETGSLSYLDDLGPDTDPQLAAQIAELKKSAPPSSTTNAATFTIGDDGALSVTETSGHRPALDDLKGKKIW